MSLFHSPSLLKNGSLESSVKVNRSNWISLKNPYVILNRNIETAELWDLLYFLIVYEH